MDLFTEFSSNKNLKLALEYLKYEANTSSLSINPLATPAISAIEQIGDEFFATLQNYLREKKYNPEKADFIYANKDNFGVRPIAFLSVIDRLVYQALFNPNILGNMIDKKLYSFCFGYRLAGKDNFFKHYKSLYPDFISKQKDAFNKDYRWRIELDIQTFYENIDITALLNILQEQFQIKHESLLSVLEKQLTTWTEKPMALGIPQGANTSALLANAYLFPLDTVLDDLKSEGNFEYFRYVDDMVIMAKSADKAHAVAEKIAYFLRQYNLTINSKSRLKLLDDTEDINELKFNNNYSGLNETTQEKIDTIKIQLPEILKKIKSTGEITKIEKSQLNYYLRSESDYDNQDITDALIEIIPIRPSAILDISRYLGFFLSNPDETFYNANKNYVHSVYEKIWKIYKGNSLSEWTKFCLIKLLSAPTFAKDHNAFQVEINKIISDTSSKFLKPIGLFYKSYNYNITSVDLGFNIDDIKRGIRNAKSEAEKAIYYYFLIYLQGIEETEAIQELLYESLQSSSPEVQTMGIFLSQKINLQNGRKITGNFCRIYFKLPESKPDTSPKQETKITNNGYFTFEGKIAEDQFRPLLGMAKIERKYTRRTKSNINSQDKRVQLKDGILTLNERTGTVGFNKVKSNLNPQGQEFKYLLTLMSNKDFLATYFDLLGENQSKTNKRNLGFIIKNIKTCLGILPKNQARNKDFIKNIKGYGYKLIS